MESLESKRIGCGGRLWRGLDATRRVVLNVVFLGLVLVVGAALLAKGKPKVPSGCALVVKPAGAIVEQLTGNALDRVRAELLGNSTRETLLKDLVDAIEAARGDKRIKAVVLDLREMGPAGMTKLEDLATALKRFRSSGKLVVATADSYDQYGYYLAAHANEVWLNPQGLLLLEGFSRYATFYKDGLDRLGVDWHVFRVGEYKSAVEPFLRNDMSPEAKEANLAYLQDLWNSYVRDVAAARKLAPEKLIDYVERFPEHLAAAGGNGAKAALNAHLVDRVEPRDVLRARLVELVGEDKDEHTFKQIAFQDYLQARNEDRFGRKAKGDVVAVVVARGTISDGSRPPGQIGGDSTSALLRQARNDKHVKAIVLRVDSPGGSGFASELIRRELEVARAEGKVVVTSMGSVAASGGYWISMASDEVWASPNTITGSIGIFGMFPTFDKPLAKYLGVRVDGVGTTRFAGALRPDRPLDPEVGKAIQTLIDGGYREFLEIVAKGRKMTPEAVDKVARGRVWSGQDALALGLVDKLGSLEDAIKAAAARAKLGEKYKVRYIEKELTWKERLLQKLAVQAARALGDEVRTSRAAAPYLALAGVVARQEAELALVATETPVLAYAWVPCE